MFNQTPRLRQALTPIALAFVSLLAAVAVWVAVTREENPTRDREFPVTIPVEAVGVPDGLALLSMTPDAVVVTVRATDETFQRLTASNFRATINMTGIRDTQSTQAIVVEVVGLEDDAHVVETTARFTRVVLETEASKTVPVQVNRLGTLAQGFTVTAIDANPVEVTVIGPASSIGLVQSADADVNLTGVRSNIQQRYDLTPRDSGGAIQPRVRVEPPDAEIRLTVQQLRTPQAVPVLVDVQGQIAGGHNIVGIKAEPRIVLVTGPLEILQTLDALETEPVDINGASETITRNVELRLPDGLEADRESVNVTIEIVPSPGQRAITVAPNVLNVPDGFTAVLQTSSITVRVSGPTPVLNEMTAASIQATVDAAGLGEGVHSLEVRVVVSGNVTLDAVEPPQAVVALRPVP